MENIKIIISPILGIIILGEALEYGWSAFINPTFTDITLSVPQIVAILIMLKTLGSRNTYSSILKEAYLEKNLSDKEILKVRDFYVSSFILTPLLVWAMLFILNNLT